MKRTLNLFIILGTITLGALASDKSPSDYSLKAHILGTSRHRNQGGITSTYNAQTGAWSHGSYSGLTERRTELRIGNKAYTVRKVCKEVEVGNDYPARVDSRKIHLLLPDGKTCDANIEETHELQ